MTRNNTDTEALARRLAVAYAADEEIVVTISRRHRGHLYVVERGVGVVVAA